MTTVATVATTSTFLSSLSAILPYTCDPLHGCSCNLISQMWMAFAKWVEKQAQCFMCSPWKYWITLYQIPCQLKSSFKWSYQTLIKIQEFTCKQKTYLPAPKWERERKREERLRRGEKGTLEELLSSAACSTDATCWANFSAVIGVKLTLSKFSFTNCSCNWLKTKALTVAAH